MINAIQNTINQNNKTKTIENITISTKCKTLLIKILKQTPYFPHKSTLVLLSNIN